MCKADNLKPDSAWQAKRDFRDALAKKMRPNRHQEKVAPPPVHLPPRKKMKAKRGRK